MKRRRRSGGLGAAVEDHARRASKAAQDVVSRSHVAVENAGQGFCTRAYDNLNLAQESYGVLRANVRAGADTSTTGPQKAMVAARFAFFRRCVVPQR